MLASPRISFGEVVSVWPFGAPPPGPLGPPVGLIPCASAQHSFVMLGVVSVK